MLQDIGIIHLIGIGGIGISGIAEILHNIGYEVQGSDLTHNANVERLENMGIKVFVGHEKSNVKNVALVVKSTAVKDSNPEVVAAGEQNIPVIHRAEMLAELVRMKKTVAIAGTHGKTTTTSMVANLLEFAQFAPTVINGGIINKHGTNAYVGTGEWLVAEADESDGTFIRLPATIGVITNIDPEHLDHYGSFNNLKNAFYTFVENLPFDGFAVVCKDHATVREVIAQVKDRRVFSYGINEEELDVRAVNIKQDVRGSIFDVELSKHITGGEETTIENIDLPMPGIHNIYNALAATTVGVGLKISRNSIIQGFSEFAGVKRRFTCTGVIKGITIIDDYGHHPTEIKASLRTAKDVARAKGGKVIAVVQPHRYSRVRDLFQEFVSCVDDADTVFISNIYAAGEKPIDGISNESLVAEMKKSGHNDVSILESEENLAAMVASYAKKNDIVICLGAGTITKWANELPDQLEDIYSASKEHIKA